jgi:outer membrane immunogenic protein
MAAEIAHFRHNDTVAERQRKSGRDSVMKKMLPRCAALAVLVGGRAIAADLPPRPRIAQPAPPPVAAVYTWTGCYVGGYLGGAWSAEGVDTVDPSSAGGTFYNSPQASLANGGLYSYDLRSSVIGGGTLGCNWQGVGSPFVLGVEAEGGYMNLHRRVIDPYSAPGFASDTFDRTHVGDWYAAITGRLGYAVDRTLFYVKGGVGFSDVRSSIVDNCTTAPCGPGSLNAVGSTTSAFWVAGGGIEWAWTQNWTVKGEYLFLGIQDNYPVCGPGGGTAAGSTFCSTHSVNGIHTGKVGLNYKFN